MGYFDIGMPGLSKDPEIVKLWEIGATIPPKKMKDFIGLSVVLSKLSCLIC